MTPSVCGISSEKSPDISRALLLWRHGKPILREQVQRFVFERIKNRLVIFYFWVRYNQMKKRNFLKWVLYPHFHRKIACPKPFFGPDRRKRTEARIQKTLLVSLGTRPKEKIHITSGFQVKIWGSPRSRLLAPRLDLQSTLCKTDNPGTGNDVRLRECQLKGPTLGVR